MNGILGSTPQATCHPNEKYFAKGFCKACYSKKYCKQYYKKNKKKILKATKEWTGTNKEKRHEHMRRWQLKQAGWTSERYDSAFIEQQGKCAICKQPSEGRVLDADHKHSDPPKPRGLLCNRHNQMLGLCGDDIETLASAIAYLRKYSDAP